MSDLSNKIIADLKVELAESKAAANRVTESMGSEIMRLQGELEQQRTRAEALERELREEKAHADGMSQTAARLLDKRDAIRAHLAGVDVDAIAERANRMEAPSVTEMGALLACAWEALEP